MALLLGMRCCHALADEHIRADQSSVQINTFLRQAAKAPCSVLAGCTVNQHHTRQPLCGAILHPETAMRL